MSKFSRWCSGYKGINNSVSPPTENHDPVNPDSILFERRCIDGGDGDLGAYVARGIEFGELPQNVHLDPDYVLF